MNEDVNINSTRSAAGTDHSNEFDKVAETLELLRSNSQIVAGNQLIEPSHSIQADKDNQVIRTGSYTLRRSNSNLVYNQHTDDGVINLPLPPAPKISTPTDTVTGPPLNTLFSTLDDDTDDDEYIPRYVVSSDDETIDNNETVAYRTRARHPLTEYTIDELEATLNEVLDRYDHTYTVDNSNVELSEEYKQFVETLQQSPTNALPLSDSEDEIFVPSSEDDIDVHSHDSVESDQSIDDEFANNNSVRISKRELRDLRRDRTNLSAVSTPYLPNIQSMATRRMIHSNTLNNDNTAQTSDTPLRRSRRTGAVNSTFVSPGSANSFDKSMPPPTLPLQSSRNIQFHKTANTTQNNNSHSVTDNVSPARVNVAPLPSNLIPHARLTTVADVVPHTTSTTPATVIKTTNKTTQPIVPIANITVEQIATLRKQVRDHTQLLMQTRVLAQAVKLHSKSGKHKKLMDNVVDTTALCLNEITAQSQLAQAKFDAAYFDTTPILSNNLLPLWTQAYETEVVVLRNNKQKQTNDRTNGNTSAAQADVTSVRSTITNQQINDSITEQNREHLDASTHILAHNKELVNAVNQWWNNHATTYALNQKLKFDLHTTGLRYIWSPTEDILLAQALKRYGGGKYAPGHHADNTEFNRHTNWNAIRKRYLPAYTVKQLQDRVTLRSNKSGDNPIKQVLSTTKPTMLTMTAVEISQLRLGVQEFTSMDNVISWSSIRNKYLPHWTAVHLRVMYNKLYNTSNHKAKELKLRRRMQKAGIDVSRKNKHKFQQYEAYLQSINGDANVLNDSTQHINNDGFEMDEMSDDEMSANEQRVQQQLLHHMDGFENEELTESDSDTELHIDTENKENQMDEQTNAILQFIDSNEVNNVNNQSFEIDSVDGDDTDTSRQSISQSQTPLKTVCKPRRATWVNAVEQHKHVLSNRSDARYTKRHKLNQAANTNVSPNQTVIETQLTVSV